MRKLSMIIAAAAIGSGLYGSFAADAATLISPTGGSCTTNNCNATKMRAIVSNQAGSAFAIPFTIEVQVSAGNCLRVAVTQQDDDLETVVVSPDGTVWRDDDGGAGTQPLVKIANTPSSGFYTVQVSHFNAVAIDAGFDLAIGNYSPGNPNCAGPTPPIATAERSTK